MRAPCQGDPEGWASELPLYHYFTTDGKMVVGEGGRLSITYVGTSLAFYKDRKGLFLENSEKSLKRGSGASWLQGQKRLKTEPKTRKNLKNSHF